MGDGLPRAYVGESGLSVVGGGRPAGDPSTWLRLAANESSQGCSPLARAAVLRAADGLHRYPEPSSAALRRAIGAAWGMPPEGIVCGNGSEAVIESAVRCYARPGDEVLFGEYAFIQFRIFAHRVGATPVAAPETDHTSTAEALLACVTPRTKVLILDNPGNPTGTCMTAGEVRRLHAGLRPDILLVLDSAYAEYVDGVDYADGHALAAGAPNVLVTRTFSKAFGLAALRVGWAHGAPGLIEVLGRVKQIGNVGVPAQMAAEAALDDMGFMRAAVAETVATRKRCAAALAARGLHVLPSQANFLCVGFGGAAAAARAWEGLLAAGIAVRRLDDYGLGGFLRIGIGRDAEMDRLLAALDPLLPPALPPSVGDSRP